MEIVLFHTKIVFILSPGSGRESARIRVVNAEKPRNEQVDF